MLCLSDSEPNLGLSSDCIWKTRYPVMGNSQARSGHGSGCRPHLMNFTPSHRKSPARLHRAIVVFAIGTLAPPHRLPYHEWSGAMSRRLDVFAIHLRSALLVPSVHVRHGTARQIACGRSPLQTTTTSNKRNHWTTASIPAMRLFSHIA